MKRHLITTAAILTALLHVAYTQIALAAPTPIAIEPPQRPTPVDFATEVLPILRKNCLACHSANEPKAELCLETPQTIRKGGETGAAVIAGNSGTSLMLLAASHQQKPTMPPAKNKVGAVNLTPAELGLIKLWIDEGANGSAPIAATITRRPLPPGFAPIYAVAVTPDGRIAVCNRANRLFAYDLRSRRLNTELTDPAANGSTQSPAHVDLIRALAISPDGTMLASGGFRTVKLWRRPQVAQRISFVTADKPAAAVSADGRSLAVGQPGGAVQLWDVATGKLLRDFKGHTADVSAVAFSPDGARLYAAAGADVRAWTTADAAPAGALQASSPVCAIVALPGGQRVVTGGRDGQIQAWDFKAIASSAAPAADDASAIKPLRQWRTGDRPITALINVPGAAGQFIAAGEDNRLVYVDVSSDEPRRQVSHEAPIADAAVSADGRRVVTVGSPYVRLYDAAADDHRQLVAVKGGADQVLALDALRTREALAKAVTAYRKQDLKETERLAKRRDEDLKKARDERKKAEEDRDKKIEAAKDPRKELAAAEEAEQTARQAYDKAKAAVEDIARQLKAAAADSPEAEALRQRLKDAQRAANDAEKPYRDARRKREETANRTRGPIEAADKAVEMLDTLTSQLARVELLQKEDAAALAPAQQAIKDGDEQAQQLETQRKSAESELSNAKAATTAAAIAPDGRVVAVGGDGGAVQLYDGDSGAPLDVLPGHEQPVTRLAFLPDGALLWVDASGRVVVYDLSADWKLVRVIGRPDDPNQIVDRVLALAFSPDGKLLATGSGLPARRGELKLWNVDDGKLVRQVNTTHADTVQTIAFAPDGKTIVTGSADQTIKLFAAADGRLIRTLEGHTGHVLQVAVNADGKLLASSGADRVVKLWDLATGEQRTTYAGNYYRIGPFRGPVASVSFIGPTEYIVCACGDGTARLLRTGTDRDQRVYRRDKADKSFVHAVAATADGALVITGAQDGVLHVWDQFNAKELSAFPPP